MSAKGHTNGARREHAALVLEDGRAFVGLALGADVPGQGEVVFNTAMTGYQEVLTDPSYAGQMVCMTYPLQGNYGVREADAESERPWARAMIVRWACPAPSHHSSEASLDEYLRRWSVPAITEIDTRALTRHLRNHGTMRAVLSHENRPPSQARLAELASAAARVTPLSDQDLVAVVQPGPEHLRQRHHKRCPRRVEHIHVQRYAGFEIGLPEQLLHQQRGIHRAALRREHDADIFGGFVPHVVQQRQFLLVEQLGHALDQLRFLHAIGNLIDDELIDAPRAFFF